MKITNITIDNYKSIKHMSVNGLSGINMLYGYNNTGKSNLLKFIELLFRRKFRYGPIAKVSGEVGIPIPTESVNFWEGTIEDCPYIFRNNDRDLPISFKVVIRCQNDELKHISSEYFKNLKEYFFHTHDYFTLSLTGQIVALGFKSAEMLTNDITLNGKTIYSVNNGEVAYFESVEKRTDYFKTNAYQIFNEIMDIFNDCVLFIDTDRHLKSESWDKELGNEPVSNRNYKNWLYRQFLDPEKYDELEGLLRFVNDFEVPTMNNPVLKCSVENSPLIEMNIGYAMNDGEIELMLKSKMGKGLPKSSYGTGIQQLIFILSLIYSSQARIVLAEELELNLSPRYQHELLRNIRRLMDSSIIDQLFFTTHSNMFTFRSDFSIYEITIEGAGESKSAKLSKPSSGFFRRNILD